MPKSDKGVVKRVIVTPDKHFPLHDQKAINCLTQAINIVKPDIYVDLGDVGEFHAFSAWRFKRKKRPSLEYLIKDFDKDIKVMTKYMTLGQCAKYSSNEQDNKIYCAKTGKILFRKI